MSVLQQVGGRLTNFLPSTSAKKKKTKIPTGFSKPATVRTWGIRVIKLELMGEGKVVLLACANVLCV